MTIYLGTTKLCEQQERDSTGKPVGPQNLRISEVPGVAVREFVGASRIAPEHIHCDAGTVTFGVTRTYDNVADALAYASSTVFSEPVEGQLKFDTQEVFGPKSVVTNRSISVIGCTVAVNYTIQG